MRTSHESKIVVIIKLPQPYINFKVSRRVVVSCLWLTFCCYIPCYLEIEISFFQEVACLPILALSQYLSWPFIILLLYINAKFQMVLVNSQNSLAKIICKNLVFVQKKILNSLVPLSFFSCWLNLFSLLRSLLCFGIFLFSASPPKDFPLNHPHY
jgi:hypothetical protein